MATSVATKTSTKVPETMSLQVGDLDGIVFTGGSPSTGYSWRFMLGGSSSAVLRISRTVIPSPNPMISQPDLEVVAIAAMARGQETLTAELLPPGGQKPVRTHVIKINVG